MTPDQLKDFTEIRRLLKEAYLDCQKRHDIHDCRMQDGEIKLHYEGIIGANNRLTIEFSDAAVGISIYSYGLGPSRRHTWFKRGTSSTEVRGDLVDEDPVRVALDNVRKWHVDQLALPAFGETS